MASQSEKDSEMTSFFACQPLIEGSKLRVLQTFRHDRKTLAAPGFYQTAHEQTVQEIFLPAMSHWLKQGRDVRIFHIHAERNAAFMQDAIALLRGVFSRILEPLTL